MGHRGPGGREGLEETVVFEQRPKELGRRRVAAGDPDGELPGASQRELSATVSSPFGTRVR